MGGVQASFCCDYKGYFLFSQAFFKPLKDNKMEF